MKVILHRDAMLVAHAASGEDHYRKALQYVRIGDNTIVACDGFMLAKCSVTTDPESGEHILVKASHILEALNVFSGNPVLLETDGANVNITCGHMIQISMVVPLGVDMRFPEYSHIVEFKDEKASTMLNHDKLSNVLEILDTGGGKNVVVTLNGERDPVRIIRSDTEVILMPMLPPT